ncbi:MAG: Crp/Fnr family transcriptional regulator [Acidobacteria bacterium]|nr:Crp/Fnr family transcriptional regulator [Acidobacteriota bacterium]
MRSGRIELRFLVVYFNGLVEIPLEWMGAGGVCGWSAMIPPHSYTLTACATEDSTLLQINQTELEELCETNTRLGYILMKNIARIIGERYELARQILIGEIQRDLKRKENKRLWRDN